MPYRATFDCLWCGTAHECRSTDDLEGWAHLCSACVGSAGDDGFRRYRLRQALTERAAAARSASAASLVAAPAPGEPAGAVEPAGAGEPAGTPETTESVATPSGDQPVATPSGDEPRAPEYDDWYLRRGRYGRGAIHDAAWNAELDAAGRWLDDLPVGGRIIELAAGTGWWSPLLASKGELSMYDAAGAYLDVARDRLLAHGLRAHLHVRDPWAEPDGEADALFTGFWLSQVEPDRLRDFLSLARRWLRPGGRIAFIDSLPDPASGTVDHPPRRHDRAVGWSDDGRMQAIVKVPHAEPEYRAALVATGFDDIEVSRTGRFFVLGTAQAS